jgi:GntR family transcriptional regulator, arabinose operon transcriptional repressor
MPIRAGRIRIVHAKHEHMEQKSPEQIKGILQAIAVFVCFLINRHVLLGPYMTGWSSVADEVSGQTPKHERLRMRIIEDLQAGRLRPGTLLPTENELAAATRMSRNTVRQALSDLERSGVIRRVRGRGTYIDDSALHRLNAGLDLFALVIPDTRGGYYPSLQRGFHTASAELHNQVIVCDTDNDPFRQADDLLQLIDKKVAGVAIVPTTSPPTPAHQLRPLHERGIPIVFCHRRVEGLQAPLVSFSAVEVGRMAGRALIEAGHRRVAFFSAQRAGLSLQYEQGLREVLQNSNAHLPENFIRSDTTTKPTAAHQAFVEKNLRQLLGLAKPPTAIFCAFDSEAELVYLLLQRFGVRVPEDMSVVGFGGTWREGALARLLTSVAVDEEELGRKAVKLLEEMRWRRKPLDDMTEILMPLSLSDGQTLGPARHKSQ